MPALGLVNKVMEMVMSKRMRQIENFIKYPTETQENILFSNLSIARNTEYGKLYGFNDVNSYENFKLNVPLVTYEQFEPFIDKARKGIPDVTWQGKIKWLAKS